jgi:hypothetical protein
MQKASRKPVCRMQQAYIYEEGDWIIERQETDLVLLA